MDSTLKLFAFELVDIEESAILESPVLLTVKLTGLILGRVFSLFSIVAILKDSLNKGGGDVYYLKSRILLTPPV